MAKIDAFFELMHDQGASDLHLVTGQQPALRIRGEIERIKYNVLENDELKGMLYEIAPEHKVKQFEETGDVDFAYEIPNLARYRANFQDEIESAALYRVIAQAEKQPQLARVYLKMAEVEEEHAEFWVEKIVEGGQPEPDRRIGWRTQVLAYLAKRFGAPLVLPTIAGREREGTTSAF